MTIKSRLKKSLSSLDHPNKSALLEVLAGKTSVSSSHFPYISEASFRIVLREIPHLYKDGSALLSWLSESEKLISNGSVLRGMKVLRNIVYSAAICAPSDLWVIKHVLSAHVQIGVTKQFLSGAQFSVDALADRLKLNPAHLTWDLSLLHSRGYLAFRNGKFRLSDHPQAHDVFKSAAQVPDEFLCDMVEPLLKVLRSEANNAESSLVKRFLTYSKNGKKWSTWYASAQQLEIGYRLVPLVLALRASKGKFELTKEIKALLIDAGMYERNKWTDLGERVLERGPGPFGIIHAYTPYMRLLPERLQGHGAMTHVNRLKNIAASQDANRKTFQMANDSLDRFSADNSFRYNVYIEHALGQGEAVRQRSSKNGEATIQYFGADLEDAAIDRAIELQNAGTLPKNMIFIRSADIAKPQVVIDAVRRSGFSTLGAVMFVGNGFHEVRGQSNEKIVEVFHGYCEAGVVLAFTEESALSDYDLLTTAWNTYHAGFRYVHELSGQGLRPAYGTDRSGKHSWKICASLGGYAVLQKYCVHTRTIYPFPKQGGYNPPISMTYFCVPAPLARSLGFFPSGWSKQ